MRILALDLGSVRIGAALSDELGLLAHPIDFLPAEPAAAFLDRLKSLEA